MKNRLSSPIEALESRIAPASLVTVTYDAVTGALALAGDGDDNSVGVFRTGKDTYRIMDAGGTDLTQSPAGPLVHFLDIGKVTSLTITGGSGMDNFFVTGLNKLKTFNFDGGAGSDLLFATDLVVKGDAAVDFGADGGGANFDGALTRITGDVTVNYGDAGGMVTFGAITTVIKGAVGLTGGLGDDMFNLSATGNTAVVGKGIKLVGGDGNDSVLINTRLSALVGKAAITGHAIDIAGGAGTNALTINGAGAVNLKGNVVFTGGVDADEVTLQSSILSVGGELRINGGAGFDSAAIGGSKVTLSRAVTIDMADGGSTVAIAANLVALGSTLSVKGAAGGDDLSITVSQLTTGKLFFGGAGRKGMHVGTVSFEGGAGSDTVLIDAASLSIRGALTIDGGADADTVTLRSDGAITGDVTIDLGTSSDGNQDIALAGRSGLAGSFKIGGKLTVTSASDDGGIGYTDSLLASDVTVANGILITLGEADSTVGLDNVSTRKHFTLVTGEGNDTVNLAQNSFFGPTNILKIATITLGGGDDTIRIGRSSAAGSNDFVRFLDAVTVDGGAGTDASNDFLNAATNFFAPGVAKTRSNFEGAFI